VTAQMALALAAPAPRRADPREILGGVLGARVADLFDCMAVAEEELDAARLTPEQRSQAFGFLCPTTPIRGKSLDLYRAHVRELLGRLREGATLEPGTLAECLSVCLYTAGDAPLRQEGQALAEWLYAAVFPHDPARLGASTMPERWEGQVQEDLAVLRRKLAVERRAG
jgi:hypothetical protein